MKPSAFARLAVCASLVLIPLSARPQAVAVQAAQEGAKPHRWSIVMHGGAGVIERGSMSAEAEKAYRAGLDEAIHAAAAVLDRGGAALDAVEAGIKILEDNPNFNAGRGAVFTAEGRNELDAAMMDGATLKAGSVTGVTRTRHPISLARAVMEQSPHVMLGSPGADEFAAAHKLEQVPPSFFFTERRWQGLVKQLTSEGLPVPPRPAGTPPAPDSAKDKSEVFFETPANHRFGTVGLVAVDRAGNIAAGTSTGGTQAKRWNRIGDAPIIGAGTYASNKSCGVSATGTGEYFIRETVARTICALVEYKGMSIQAAADQVVQKELMAMHGDGGVIAMTPDGTAAWSFNTPGMFRAKLAEGGKVQLGIYRDEP